MADQHNDNIPAVGNTIASDIPDIKENLEWHKDCFEAICEGWSNTVTTGLHVNDLAQAVVRNSVTTDCQAVAYAAETTKSVSVDSGGIYRVTGRLVTASLSALKMRFNADTGTNYSRIYRYEIDGDTANVGYSYLASQDHIVLGDASYAIVHVLEIIFCTNPSDTSKVIVNFRHSGFTTTPYLSHNVGSAYYDGSAVLTNFNLYSAANITGTMLVERIA